MVRPRGNRRGRANLGCLLVLVLFVGALYYGVNIGEVYFKYYQLVDEMKTQARFAQALTDETIRRRLVARVQDLGLPEAAGTQVTIRRVYRPREIVIETHYEQRVTLPLFAHTFKLRPKVTEPL